MDPDFWEFEVPNPPQYVSHWELIAQEPPRLEMLLLDAADWCEGLPEHFPTAAEALAFSEEMVDERIKPYVRDLLPFYFLGGSAEDLP